MSKRAIKLSENHTNEELQNMLFKVQDDPASKEGATGIFIYNKKALNLMDDITWAMYYKKKDHTFKRVPSPIETRNW